MFLTKKIFATKNIWPKKIISHFFWLKYFFDKIFLIKIFFAKKNFLTKFFFTKIFFDQKKFLTKKKNLLTIFFFTKIYFLPEVWPTDHAGNFFKHFLSCPPNPPIFFGRNGNPGWFLGSCTRSSCMQSGSQHKRSLDFVATR